MHGSDGRGALASGAGVSAETGKCLAGAPYSYTCTESRKGPGFPEPFPEGFSPTMSETHRAPISSSIGMLSRMRAEPGSQRTRDQGSLG